MCYCMSEQFEGCKFSSCTDARKGLSKHLLKEYVELGDYQIVRRPTFVGLWVSLFYGWEATIYG